MLYLVAAWLCLDWAGMGCRHKGVCQYACQQLYCFAKPHLQTPYHVIKQSDVQLSAVRHAGQVQFVSLAAGVCQRRSGVCSQASEKSVGNT